VDAALIDSVAAYYFIISSEERFFILPDSLAEEEYVIGFRKGENALCEKVQEILSEMKADGTLGKISKRWFGSDITTVR
jgi:ABC-type amino acid transport substrate-binding protein